MNVAVLYACSYADRRALSTDQLFRFVVRSFLALLTVLHPSKVRALALEALVVGQLVDGKVPQIVVEFIVRVLESGVLVNPFELGSFNDFLHHVVFNLL